MVQKNVARGTIQTDGLESEHDPNWYMGEPAVYARNLRLLTAMRGLTAEDACKGIAEMLRQKAKAERDRVWETTKDVIAREEATKALEAARKLKVDAKWYRRLTSEGVSRSDKRTRIQFHAIARFFGVSHDSLWQPDLITFQLTDLKAPILAASNPFAVHGQKLADLLEHGGGRYNYLTSLLDSLHAEAFPNGHGTGHAGAGAWIMPDKKD